MSAVPSSQRRKIAYVKRGMFSYSNVRLEEQLRRIFPEYEIEEIDVVKDLLEKHKFVAVINFFWILRWYWGDLISRRQTVRLCFYRTPYIFRKIRQLLHARLEPRKGDFAFSIQTQSLYDASIPGLPHFVYTDHTHLTNLAYPGFPRNELFARAWVDLERQIYWNAEHVFVMSEHVRKTLADLYGCDPADSSCIFAGSNIDPSPVPLENDGFQNQTVIFVGIDWKRKGGPTLLRAFHRVLESLPKARLVVIGGGPNLRHPQIEMVGRISHDEVKRRLVRASVFCLPTRIEPFGIAVVEAFFHKLPVITSRIGAMPDMVLENETGVMVDADDADWLAKALIELLKDPEKCRRFGEQGLALVTERYSWDAVGRKLQNGVRACLERRLPAAA